MTEIATPAHRRGEIIHHRNELRNRQAAKQLHVFLATFLRDRLLLRCGRWCLRGLWHSQRVVKGRKIFSVGGRFGRAQVGNQHNRADTAQCNYKKSQDGRFHLSLRCLAGTVRFKNNPLWPNDVTKVWEDRTAGSYSLKPVIDATRETSF